MGKSPKSETVLNHRDTEFSEERPESHSRSPRMRFDSVVAQASLLAVVRGLCAGLPTAHSTLTAGLPSSPSPRLSS